VSGQTALNWIEKNESLIVEVADRIWEFAELGLEEFKSSKLIADTLREAEFNVEAGVGDMPTAFVAAYGSGKPRIGVLGEYDALPGLSQKAQPTKEPARQGGTGHGCGHNIFGAASMGAAIAIKETIKKENLRGTVKFFGCPGEENVLGKVFMARDDLFNGLDAALCWHPSMTNTVWMGSSLAENSVKFNFHGVSAHAAASPEQGRSALDAAELMNVGVNYLREHVTEKTRIHYVVTKGGSAPNVVPPEAQVWYYIRAPRRVQVEELYSRIQNIARGACLMTGTTVDFDLIGGCHEFVPNKTLSYLMLTNMKQLGPPKWTSNEIAFAKTLSESLTPDQKKTTMENMNVPHLRDKIEKVLDDTTDDPDDEGLILPASTDVGDVSYIVPTAQILAATTILGAPSHGWQMTATSGMSIGHKGGTLAAKVIALTGIDLLSRPQELKKVKEEFSAKGMKYRSFLPKDLKPSPIIV
jgi:aminobenzoyl-glutamate utilization protein B